MKMSIFSLMRQITGKMWKEPKNKVRNLALVLSVFLPNESSSNSCDETHGILQYKQEKGIFSMSNRSIPF